MHIATMRTNALENPLGFDMEGLTLSWRVTDTRAVKTQSAQVWIAHSPEFSESGLVYDSGPRTDIHASGFHPEVRLAPATRYWWKVRVEGDNGEQCVSEPAWFETAEDPLLDGAAWIGAALDPDVHPCLRKAFDIPEAVVSARLRVAGAGLFTCEINGQLVTPEVLLPGYSAYDLWMQVFTFDVADTLREGENVLGAMLGKGWYAGRFGLGGVTENYGKEMALCCALSIELASGRTMRVISDDTWLSRPGPVLFSGIYDGEHVDARLAVPDWSQPGCDTGGWTGVRPVAVNAGPFCARLSPPILVQKRLSPVAIIRTPKGETVLDFGQNMAGWVEFDADLPEGKAAFLQYGELLQDGCFYRENLRSAKAEFRYVSEGKPAHVCPRFTFFGFRYVRVEGLPAAQANMTACVIHSQMDEIGEILTSDARVNKLIQNANWGRKGNFLDVPTDCPQRDERMGWTGDAQIFSGTACYQANTAAFFHKYLRDMREEQLLLDGSIPLVVPRVRKQRDIGEGHGSCAWGDAATVIPWNLYIFYGNQAMLASHYPLMKDWVDHIRRIDEANGGKRLWHTGMHIADWLALDNPDPDDIFTGGTDNHYVASVYYAHSAGLVAKAAAALGKLSEAEEYRALHEEVVQAIREEYFTPNGKLSIDTQTAHVLALSMELAPEAWRRRLKEALVGKLVRKGVHLDTGFVGTPYLCRALSGAGEDGYAYRLLMNEDMPGWLYPIRMGATTIWERWNSVMPDGRVSSTGMNSMNHYAYGSVVEWIARDVCGLNPMEEAPGFRKARIAPKPVGYLQHAGIRYRSVSGEYVSQWQMAGDGRIRCAFTIPFDCGAVIELPDATVEALSLEGTTPLSMEAVDGKVLLTVSAGSMAVSWLPTRDRMPHLDLTSTLQTVLDNPQGREVLERHLGKRLERMSHMPGMLERAKGKPLTNDPIFGLLSGMSKEETDVLARDLRQCRIPWRTDVPSDWLASLV